MSTSFCSKADGWWRRGFFDVSASRLWDIKNDGAIIFKVHTFLRFEQRLANIHNEQIRRLNEPVIHFTDSYQIQLWKLKLLSWNFNSFFAEKCTELMMQKTQKWPAVIESHGTRCACRPMVKAHYSTEPKGSIFTTQTPLHCLAKKGHWLCPHYYSIACVLRRIDRIQERHIKGATIMWFAQISVKSKFK